MLQKHIGKKSLFLLTINAILGTGIFFLPAVGYAHAGAASLYAWIAMGMVAVLISLYFAELISLYPRSGGVYEYTKHAFGEFTSFIAGWTSWIVANITIAMLIVGSLRYLFPAASLPFNIAASLLIIFIFNYISYRGIKLSAAIMTIFGIATLAALFAVIFPGATAVSLENFAVMDAALPALLLTIYLIAETFFGWETTTYLSEEIRDARRVLPKMLIVATVAIAIISIALVAVSIGVAGAELGTHPAPLALVGEKLFGGYSSLFTLLIFVPLIGTAASWIISSPRLLYAMARDRVVSTRLQKLSSYRTPQYAIALQAAVTAAVTLIGFADYFTILQMLLPLVIVMYSFVMLSVVKLRINKSKLHRAFSAPAAKEMPILIIIFLFYMLYLWALSVPYAGALLAMDFFLILFGVPLYFLIKLSTDRRFVEKFFDRMSPLMDKTLPLWYSKKDVAGVVRRLNLRRDSVVLDFGAGSGYTTTAIAHRIPDGIVVAVDISEKQLERAVARAKRRREHNIIFVKESDPRFQRGAFDAVAGVGVLEYLDKPERTVHKLMTLLKKNGRFCFLSFGRSFAIPAPQHLANEKAIRALFPKNASVRVKRQKRKMTEYWTIWGEKK